MTEKSSKEIISSMSFCVFDLETTGGDHKSDKIIEIGMVKVKKLQQVEERDFLIQPEIQIPDFIQKLTTITPSDVEGAPIIEEVIDEILEFMGDSILVAHNTSFDVPFFNSVLKRLGRPILENKSLCTNLMTKYLIPNLMNSNLHYMSRIFGIRHKKAHRALDDAKATASLLQKYLKIFIEKGIQKPNHLYYPRNRFELNQISYKKDLPVETVVEKLEKIKSPYLFTLKGENGVINFSYPCRGDAIELEFLDSKLRTVDYNIITIKLYGPFIESFVHFANHFNKIENALRQEIIGLLWKTHLKGQDEKRKISKEAGAGEELDLGSKLEGDFIITNHLVPDQYIIYPIRFLGHKSELVFRYPAHRKKLIQFINSRSAKINSNKFRRSKYHFQVVEFLNTYLSHKKQSNSDIMLFKKELVSKTPEVFFSALEGFLAKNPNPYNYPKEYI